jgi:hypothetical protein
MADIELTRGNTFSLTVAVGVGGVMPFEASGNTFEFQEPHCLAEGDRVILCNIPDSCPQLENGQCVEVVSVPNSKSVKLNITAPNDSEGSLVKAASLNGFRLVARFGNESEEHYLNYASVCAGDNQILLAGCFDVPTGSKVTLANAYNQPADTIAKFAGQDGKQNYTIIIADRPAAKTVTESDRKFAVIKTPDQLAFSAPASDCGILNLSIAPAQTKLLPKNSVLPFSIAIERGWDMSTFNKKHGTNCPWRPDFSHLLLSGNAHIR